MNNYYEEKKPFIFISYKREDSAVVRRTIQELHDRYGFNIWYDAELTAGTKWDKDVKTKIRSPFCKVVLLFASEAALISDPIQRELGFAKKYGKLIIPINFENKSFSNVLLQIIERYNEDDSDKVDIAEAIVSEHLDDKLTYIVKDIESDSYYSDIYRAIEKNAPELIRPSEEAEQPAAEAAETAETVTPPEPVHAPVHPVSEVKPEAPADPEPDELEDISDTAAPGSTSAGPAASKAGTKLTYTLFGSTKTSSQSEMMYDVFGTVLERFPDKYNDILSLNCVSDTDLSLKTIMDKKAQFNSCRTFRTAEGRILCVGAGYSINDKLRHIARLLNICGLDSSVLTIEGYELPRISADAPAGDPGRAGRNGSVLDYTIFGEQKTGTQGDIMYDIFEQALKRYPEKYNDMLSLNCAADTDYTKDSSEGKAQFRACKTFYTADGRVFCVGTSYGMDAKLRQIAKMMAICGIDRSQLVIDGYELPEKVSAASGEASDRSIASGTGISYELYGEHMNCQNQSEMMIQVFENVISRHLDKISEILELGCVSETDYSHEKKSGADFPSQFRAGKLVAAGERSVYIGTAYSLNAKYKLIKQLLSICGEPADVFNVTDI